MKTHFWFRTLIVSFLGTMLAFFCVETGAGEDMPSLREILEAQKLMQFGETSPELESLTSMMEGMADSTPIFREPLYQSPVPINVSYEKFRKGTISSSLLQGAVAFNDEVIYFSERIRATGNLQLLEKLSRRRLASLEGELGPKHHHLAPVIADLAGDLSAKGDYTGAEHLYRRALGLENTNTAIAVNDLAEFYRAQGDYARALPLFERALKIREQALGRQHQDYAAALNNLGVIYHLTGEFTKAISWYKTAQEITEKALAGIESSVNFGLEENLSIILSNHGVACRAQGEVGKAVKLFTRAHNIHENVYWAFFDSMAENPQLKMVASFALETDALISFQHDVAHKDPQATRLALTVLLQRKGRVLELLAATTAAIHRAQSREEADTPEISSVSVEELRRKHQRIDSEIADLKIKGPGDDDPYEHRMRLKQLKEMERATRSRIRSILKIQLAQESPAQEIQEVANTFYTPSASVEELQQIRSEIANLTIKGPGDSDPEEHDKRVQQLEKKQQVITRSLVGIQRGREIQEDWDRLDKQQGRRFEDRKQLARTQLLRGKPNVLNEIQRLIPEGAALVEFADYRPFIPGANNTSEKWGPRHYAAYILHSKGEPQSIDLGDAAKIDRTIYEFRRNLRDPRNTNVTRIARKLDELLMRPIRSLLGATNFVLLAPDGLLNIVPFGALMDEDHRYLIESSSFTYLTSGRDLLSMMERKGESRQRSIVIGNPDFDTGGRTKQVTHADESSQNRRSSDFAFSRFTPLPGTASEAKAISEILPDMELWAGQHANESALKRVHGPPILHIATHAFFLSDFEPFSAKPTGSARNGEHRDSKRGVGIIDIYENPLLRSGLVLAGVNQLRSGGTDDGVLTALEATTLDLWGTELVVLSACETGLGEMQTGEGVYGLRRAFMIAGAESQLTSLWKVDDAATRDLMVAYYKRLLSGEGRSEALRQTQLAMLASKRQSHPYYWACFIPVGEWASLEMN